MGSPARSRRTYLLLLVALCGLAVVALSPVPAWLVHVRHVGGHGLTAISVVWNAWEGRAWPFLPAAVSLAGLVALLAMFRLARPATVRSGWLPAASLLCLALLAASLLPLDRTGYASRVQMTAGWGLVLAFGLAAVMMAVAVLLAGWGRRVVALGVVAGVLVLAGSYGGRVVALNLAEGDPRHYSDGEYERQATGGQPTERLVIREGTYAFGDRWSGTISGRGLVAVLTDDPACPGVRGSYRVFGAGGEDIRFNAILDLCADGERERDLTTGTWRRLP